MFPPFRFGSRAAKAIAAIPPGPEPVPVRPGAVLPHLATSAATQESHGEHAYPRPLPTAFPPQPEPVPRFRFGPLAAEAVAAIPPRPEPVPVRPGAVLPHLATSAATREPHGEHAYPRPAADSLSTPTRASPPVSVRPTCCRGGRSNSTPPRASADPIRCGPATSGYFRRKPGSLAMSTLTLVPLPATLPSQPKSFPPFRFGSRAAFPIAAIPPRPDPVPIQPGAVLPHLATSAATRGAPR